VKRIPGVVTGIVNSLDDPEGLGRLQLIFPWMADGEPQSNWARIAVPMAGPERGMQFMPEVGDEVLVAFEQGELRVPYVVGYLWNGQDAPPREESAQRAIQTVSGHVLEFDDTDGSEKISLLFKGDKPSIILDEKTATVETAGGHVVKLDDDAGITLSFQGSDPTVTLETGKLTLSASGSTVELSASGVKISGTLIELN
jgi:uncharacterized protein involved in type VI secretion and phage assembly